MRKPWLSLDLHSRRRFQVFRPVLALAALVIAGVAGPAAASDPWNPVPTADDIVFALPCDEKIVFRKIITQELAEGPSKVLDDRRLRLGSSEVQRAYLDYLRTEFIAGHFVKDKARFYLLGKYETTAAQYKSVVGSGDCQFQDDDQELPVSKVSWYDATEFTRKLTGYLLKNQNAELKAALGTADAYVRLPTEVEWEFAVRGGLAVSAADFQSERFPMEDDVKAYAWFNDPLSSAGELNPIGLLKPNPLGLYDMYGNVAEIMLEPFTLNKAGRAHGLAGGTILKGGSFQSNVNYVTSADRQEDALFDASTSEEKQRRTTGFRVAIAGLALPTGDDVNRLADEWEASSASELPANENPMTLIGRLKTSSSDLQLSNDLAAVEQAMRTELAADADKRKQLLGGLLISVGKSFADIRTRYRSFTNRTALLQAAAGGALSQQDIQALQTQLRDDQSYIQELNYFGHDMLVTIIANYDASDLDNQAKIAAAELRQRNLDGVADGVLIAAAVARELQRGNRQYTREEVLRLALNGL
ncbi:hypothetical protein ELI03_35320 [Rhizobium leguminosarum]|uniref:Sulfatase-modifying factor enzyme-like domain-containing protein n=1 Tax=Rhizobium leguminosarum TaxID=384 RepID=A0A4Q8XNU9_RHILE|nr:SUMF1/EgtB/PvdO family nonheme iron enzyme [Rhizobium leguminosarum]TAX64121.1 hypothetical protein ELI03_35320 [Rhizobium leguminosarum]